MKMNEEVETAQLDQTEHNIQSQLPFLVEQIKQEQMCMKAEEISSYEDSYRKVRTVDRFHEAITGLEKVEQPDLCGENVQRHIKDEICASTCSYFTESYADVEKMEHSGSDQHSQLVVNNTVSENLVEEIIKTETITGDVGEALERLLVHMKKLVKNAGDVVSDLGGLPEHMHIHEINFKRDRRPNELVKLRECQVILEDIMVKITQNDDSLSLNNGECSRLSGNVFCISKDGIKQNVSSAGCDKVYRCNVCGVVFITYGDQSSHTREHKDEGCCKDLIQSSHLNTYKIIRTRDNPYKCNVCGKEFTYTNALNSHKRVHTGKTTYKCDVCGKGYVQAYHLIAHKRIHTGETPYKCEVCGKQFTYTGNLNAHKRIHTREKPYKCNDKRYTKACHLMAHKRIHTEEKSYKCDVCGKGYAQACHLFAHKRVHTGETPYKCDVCGKEFTYTNNLNAHKRIHTGETPYKCDVCGKEFTYTNNFNAHKRIHTGEKPYKSDVCGKEFTYTNTHNPFQLVGAIIGSLKTENCISL